MIPLISGRVFAVDLDADTNAQVYYHILNANQDQLHIDKLHGMLYTSASLDREARSNYSLVVAASNSPTMDPVVASALTAAAKDKALPQYTNGSLATVTIHVDDENDSAPKFAKKEFFAGGRGTRIVRVVLWCTRGVMFESYVQMQSYLN